MNAIPVRYSGRRDELEESAKLYTIQLLREAWWMAAGGRDPSIQSQREPVTWDTLSAWWNSKSSAAADARAKESVAMSIGVEQVRVLAEHLPPSIAEAEGRRKFSKLSRAATLPDQQLKGPQQEQTPPDQVLWMHRDLPAALLHATAESGSKIPLCRKNQKQAKAAFTTAVIHLEGAEAGD